MTKSIIFFIFFANVCGNVVRINVQKFLMKFTQITIKDIAQKLNISPSTVSRALRNHPDIKPKTKELVVSLARELDYHPNSIAQSLQKKRTNTIGVIVPEIRHHFFSSVISGIEDVGYEAGFTIIVCQSNEDSKREEINIRALLSNRVAGLLISISQTTENDESFFMLQRRNIPFVFFDRVLKNFKTSKVIVDDFDGAFKAVEHLILSGYKRIAHLAGPQYISISNDRLQGYLFALQKYNIPFENELVIYGGFNEEDGIIGLQKLLRLNKLPDAIFAVNDPVAIGTFIQIKENGLKIPDDIALIGFSNNPIASLIDPPLTTIAQPMYEIGQTAAKLLIEQIENSKEPFEPKIEILKTQLIIRKST